MKLFCLYNPPPELKNEVRYRDLNAEERLYFQGDRVDAVYCVVSGRLRIVNQTPQGNLVPLYVVGPGECVSEAALFAERYCSDAIAETPSRVARYPTVAVLATFERNPELAREFMALQSRRFNILRARMELRSIRSARERVIQYLEIARLPGSSERVIDRPLKSIAEDIGLSHEALYRTVSQLKREGIIEQNGKSIRAGGPAPLSGHGPNLRGEPKLAPSVWRFVP